MKEYKKPSCGFCGKLKEEIKRLVPGPRVSICNECIYLCDELLADDNLGALTALDELISLHPETALTSKNELTRGRAKELIGKS